MIAVFIIHQHFLLRCKFNENTFLTESSCPTAKFFIFQPRSYSRSSRSIIYVSHTTAFEWKQFCPVLSMFINMPGWSRAQPQRSSAVTKLCPSVETVPRDRKFQFRFDMSLKKSLELRDPVPTVILLFWSNSKLLERTFNQLVTTTVTTQQPRAPTSLFCHNAAFDIGANN